MSRSTTDAGRPLAARRLGFLAPRHWWTRVRSTARPVQWFWRVAPESAQWREQLSAFAARCEREQGGTMDVALSSALLYACVPPVAAGRMDDRTLRAYARTQFAHYLGDAGDAWAIATCSRPAAPLAIGMPRTVCEALLAAAGSHSVRLRHVRPWWTLQLGQVLQGAGPATVALVAAEPRFACGLQIEKGRLTRVVADSHEEGAFDADAFAAAHGLQGRLHLAAAPAEAA